MVPRACSPVILQSAWRVSCNFPSLLAKVVFYVVVFQMLEEVGFHHDVLS